MRYPPLTITLTLAFLYAPHTNAQGISEVLRQMMLDEVRENGDKGSDYSAYRSECSKRICVYNQPYYTGPVEYMTPYGRQLIYYVSPTKLDATASTD